jgi:hypothetical protein
VIGKKIADPPALSRSVINMYSSPK